MNGLGFERYVANLLRAQGLTVYRSAASRGCADLVVSNDERQYLTVQCKKHGRVRYVRESGAVPSAEKSLGNTAIRRRATAVPGRPDSDDAARNGAAANDVPDLRGLRSATASVLASAPSVGSPSSGREDEEASRA